MTQNFLQTTDNPFSVLGIEYFKETPDNLQHRYIWSQNEIYRCSGNCLKGRGHLEEQEICFHVVLSSTFGLGIRYYHSSLLHFPQARTLIVPTNKSVLFSHFIYSPLIIIIIAPYLFVYSYFYNGVLSSRGYIMSNGKVIRECWVGKNAKERVLVVPRRHFACKRWWKQV
jgi:hypothetical protein